jgi:hypothetical protein
MRLPRINPAANLIYDVFRVGPSDTRRVSAELDIEQAEIQNRLADIRMRIAELKADHDHRLALRKAHGKFPYGGRKKSGSWRNGWREDGGSP